jgi:hypothetical protein
MKTTAMYHIPEHSLSSPEQWFVVSEHRTARAGEHL